MKKTILILSVIFLASGSVFAQSSVKGAKTATAKTVAKAKATKNAKAQPLKKAGDAMKFKTEDHNFGTIAEGPSVSFDFFFKNTTKQPIQLESVRASCGCTTPHWDKQPVLPGKTSKITAVYNTKGRPGNFYKTITVKSTAGQKVLKIKGVVEKAAASSVPASKSSMMKH